jgi:hypothetical protein
VGRALISAALRHVAACSRKIFGLNMLTPPMGCLLTTSSRRRGARGQLISPPATTRSCPSTTDLIE